MRKAKLGKVTENADLKKEISFPTDYEIPLEEALVQVEAPYQIVEEGGRKYITASWYVESGKSGLEDREKMLPNIISREYNPFHVEKLYEKVSKILLPDEDSILAFCNEYGPIGSLDEETPINISGNKKTIIGTGAPLENFIQEARIINQILRYHYEIQNDFVILPKDSKTKYKEIILKFHPELTSQFDYFSDQTIVKIWITLWVNRKLPMSSRRLKVGKDGSYVTTYTSNSLLGAIYHQLEELLTSSTPLKKCLYCKDIFPARRIDSNFCAPDIPGNIGSCKNNYNQMKSRARKWFFSGERKLEEIAAHYERPLSEVQRWMDEFTGKRQET